MGRHVAAHDVEVAVAVGDGDCERFGRRWRRAVPLPA